MRSISAVVILLAASSAHAQPVPEPTPPPSPDPVPSPDPAPVPDPAAGWTRQPDPAPPPTTVTRGVYDSGVAPALAFDAPDILVAPTGRLLPAGVLYSRSLIDTSGGFGSDLRVGLGDVAEFGVSTTDLVRERQTADDAPRRISPYATASFRMGVAEDRIFRGMPALALGFEKSFERHLHHHTTRIAELHLVASKRLGPRAVVHLGAVFWDASLQPDGADAVLLHDAGVGKQLRGVGGVELRPLDDAEILIDLAWVPEFCYECTDDPISLTAILSWGVRYEVAPWLRLESGVRVPDIDEANLLDAQIFGQVVMVSHRLVKLVER
jgi:hypothetical protein